MEDLTIMQKNASLQENKELDGLVIAQKLREEQDKVSTQAEKDDISKNWLNKEMDMYEAALILEEAEQKNKDFVKLAKKSKGNSLFYKEKNGRLVEKSRFEIKETKEEIAKYRTHFAEEKQKVKFEECKKYFKERLRQEYSSFAIKDKEIEDFISKELLVKSFTQVKEELDCVQAKEFIRKDESLVHVNQEQINEYGASARVQHFPAIVAKKIVDESNGFLTMVKNDDRTYRLRPSLPGGTYQYKLTGQHKGIPSEMEFSNLRETYNLYCKFYAYGMTHGLMDELIKERNSYCMYGMRSSFLIRNEDKTYALRNDIRGILAQLGASEANISDFTLLLDLLHFDEEAFKGVSEFQNGALTSYYIKLKAGEKLEQAIDFSKDKDKYQLRYDDMSRFLTDEEKQQLLGGEKLTGDALDKKVLQICEEFRTQMNDVQKELVEISNMDLKSPEIALFGACSANAMFMKNFVRQVDKKGEPLFEYLPLEHGSRFEKHGVEDIQYRRAFILQELEDPDVSETDRGSYKSTLMVIDDFLDKIEKGEIEFNIKNDNVKTVCNSVYEKMSTFHHHAATVVYENAEFAVTSEAFAAETNQFMVSPLQRSSSYVGIFRKKQEDRQFGFMNYYGEDIGANYGIRQLKEDMVNRLANGIKV